MGQELFLTSHCSKAEIMELFNLGSKSWSSSSWNSDKLEMSLSSSSRFRLVTSFTNWAIWFSLISTESNCDGISMLIQVGSKSGPIFRRSRAGFRFFLLGLFLKCSWNSSGTTWSVRVIGLWRGNLPSSSPSTENFELWDWSSCLSSSSLKGTAFTLTTVSQLARVTMAQIAMTMMCGYVWICGGCCW